MIQTIPKGNNGIEEGARFQRGVGGAMTEIAEIVEVTKDRLGIPHVRYNTYLMRGHYKASAPEQRTLALDSFCARYKERLEAGQAL